MPAPVSTSTSRQSRENSGVDFASGSIRCWLVLTRTIGNLLNTARRLVVVVIAMQAAGYVALRAIGPRYGLLFTGFLGGFVSSTATVAVMGRRAVEEPRLRRIASAAAIAFSVATIVLLAAVVGAASVPVLRALALPLSLAGVAAIGYALAFGLRAIRQPEPQLVEPGRAFDLKVALLLAATVTAVLLQAGALNAALGCAGLIIGTAIAGFADSRSAAISAATLTSPVTGPRPVRQLRRLPR